MPAFQADAINTIDNRNMMAGDHCFDCIAGAGSSCGGAIVQRLSRSGFQPLYLK